MYVLWYVRYNHPFVSDIVLYDFVHNEININLWLFKGWRSLVKCGVLSIMYNAINCTCTASPSDVGTEP